MKKITVILAFMGLFLGLENGVQAQCTDGTDCYLAIEAQDGYGDGWNGNEITFEQNGVTVGSYTLNDGFIGYDTIRICIANGVVTCNWTPGLYANEVSFTITDSLGSVLYECFSGSSFSTGTFATLAPCPSCLAPTGLKTSGITPDGVTISWTELGSADEWYYCYGTTATPSGEWVSASDTSVTLTGLQANTRYWFFVYSDCGAGDTSIYSVYSFRSACGETELPYIENFESTDGDEMMPFCWTRWESPFQMDYWTDNMIYYPYVDDYEGHSGTSSFYFLPSYGTQSVISPKIPAPANTLEVQMWIMGGEVVQVGYVTTTDSADAVFHHVATVGPSDDTTINEWGYQYTVYKWTHVTVLFDTVNCTDSVYVVLRAQQSLEYESLYIDDLVIRQINNCPEPENVTMTGTASGEISLAWTCAGGSQWEVAYGPAGFNPNNATMVVDSDTTAVTLTDLGDTILYDIYVRTVCGTQYSYWSSALRVMPNVHVVSASIDTVTSCGITIVDNGGIDGVFSLGLNQVVVLLPDEEGQTMRIRGFAHLYNTWGFYEEDMNILRVYAGSDTNGMLLANYNTVNDDNIDITSEVGAMTLWFRSGYYSGDENDGFQFLVSCEEQPSCTTPYGLTMSNVSGTYAMASWEYSTANGEAPGFTLTLLNVAGEVVNSYSLNGDVRSYIIDGLSEHTTYHLLLSVDCAGTDTVEVTFTTVCNSGGEVSIGSGTSTNSYIPAYLYAKSSISQQLFLAEELVDVPAINGFKVYMTSSGATPDRQWDVFLDTTTLTFYDGTYDYITPTMANRYYSGTVSFSQGWVTVNFDSAFTVPEGKNVVLTINDKTGVTGSSRSFRTTSTDNTMTLYAYSLNGVIDATGSDFFSNTSGYLMRRNTIRIISECNTSSCQPPIIVGVEPDIHSVTLTWVTVGPENEWKVEYRTGTGAWTTATASTTDTTYTVTGLNAITTYVFRVSSICGTEEAGHTVTATTLCGEEPLPFSENFEVFLASSYSDEMQPCWARGSELQSMYSYYPARDSYYSHAGSYSMAMGGYRSYLVLPAMEIQVDSLSVSFYAANMYPEDGEAVLEVGVCTDPNDTTTFTVLTTYAVNETDWLQIDAELEGYTGTNGRIFIRLQQSDYRSVYIDDIVVDRLPDCRRVSSVTVSEIGLTSATLTLTDGHNYGNYIVYYGSENDTATADTMAFTGTTVTLTGLTENTRYYVWVVASCAQGSVSRTYAVPAFRTYCSPVVVTEDTPYLEEFESQELECMSQESTGGLRWTVSTGFNNVHSHSGSNMLTVASELNQSVMLVLPVFDFTALDEDAEFSFYRYQIQSDVYSYTTVPAGLIEVYYRTSPSATWTLLAPVDSSTNAWERFVYTLPSSQGVATYQVALKGNPMGNTLGLFVDDIMVTAAPNCRIPQNVMVRNITDRSATIAWTGDAPAYRVQYRGEGALSWITRTTENVDTLNISPLNMAERYEVRVAAVCSPSERSENSSVVSFVTDFCDNRLEMVNYGSGAVATFSEVALVNTNKGYSYSEVLIDSEALTGMTEMNGMAFYIDSVGGASYMTDCQIYMGHTSASSMSAFLYDTSFVMVYDGDISTTTTGIRRVLFNTPFVWDGQSNVVVGVMYTTPDYDFHGATRFSAHQSSVNKVYYGGSQYTEFTPDQANSISAANRAASNVVPDITLYGCLPTCHEPVLSAVTTTSNSITVAWYNENAIVQVQMKEASASAWEEPVVINLNHTDVHSYTYTSLPDRTSYNIRLRRDCADEEIGFSDWVEFDVSTDTACSIPQGVTVSDIGATSATIGWTDGDVTGSMWEIRVWNSEEEHYFDVTTNPASVTGLTAGATYHVAVRAYCCADNHVVGEYSETVTFDNVCQPVNGLTAHRNGNDVTLTWHSGENNISWVYLYGYEGFEPNQQLGYGVVQDTVVTISGLADGAIYTFRVRARCGEDWNSVWSGDVSCSMVDIDEAEAANARFAMMPNPASDRVLVQLSAFSGMAKVTVLGVDGRVMGEFGTSEADLSMDVSAFAAGAYFVRVQTNEWVAVKKLVIR